MTADRILTLYEDRRSQTAATERELEISNMISAMLMPILERQLRDS